MRCRKVGRGRRRRSGARFGAALWNWRDLRYSFAFFLLTQLKLFGRSELGDGCVHDHL